MKVIVVQGAPCLGKTSLCETLCERLSRARHLCVDRYKERLWDERGFDSAEEREAISAEAKKIFLRDVSEEISRAGAEYLLLDYPFHGEFSVSLSRLLSERGVPLKTVYMECGDRKSHERAWSVRSRDFGMRHPGHGATVYRDGRGSGYSNSFNEKISPGLPVFGETLRVGVGFNPYRLSRSISEIVSFVMSCGGEAEQ